MIRPDDFAGRPMAYAANQSGHMIIGMVLTALAALITPTAAPVAAVVTYAVLIEAPQIPHQNWRFWDGVEDCAWVGAGALIWHIHSTAILITATTALLVGMAMRWRNRHTKTGG